MQKIHRNAEDLGGGFLASPVALGGESGSRLVVLPVGRVPDPSISLQCACVNRESPVVSLCGFKTGSVTEPLFLDSCLRFSEPERVLYEDSSDLARGGFGNHGHRGRDSVYLRSTFEQGRGKPSFPVGSRAAAHFQVTSSLV